VTVTASIERLPEKICRGAAVAVPRAVDVPPVSPGLNVTLGAVVYPEPPPFVRVTDATTRSPTAAVAVAPLPPPPVNPTVGALVYPVPVPAAATVTADTNPVVSPAAVVFPVALVPPVAGTLKVGTIVAPIA